MFNKKWFAGSFLVLSLVLLVFLAGHSAGESDAITGYGIWNKLFSKSSSSPTGLQVIRTNTNRVQTRNANQITTNRTRTNLRQDEHCTLTVTPNRATTSNCMPGLQCMPDLLTNRNTCQWWNVGETCSEDRDCATGLCGLNNSRQRVCEEVNSQSLNSRCINDRECALGLICGVYDVNIAESSPAVVTAMRRCEMANQVRDTICERNRECVSRNCVTDRIYANSYGDRYARCA